LLPPIIGRSAEEFTEAFYGWDHAGMRLPEEIPAPHLRKLYEWWRARHVGGKLPSRRQIDPFDLKFLLGNLMIIDVTHDPLRFRFRLIGTNIASHMERDWTGQPLDTYPGAEFREHLRKTYEAVVSDGQPVSNSRRLLVDGRYYRYDGLIVPLSTDGKTIDALLVGIVPYGDSSPAR
jgi:hypothetical protein